MTEFNKNYLNHKFIALYNEVYECSVCGCRGFISNDQKTHMYWIKYSDSFMSEHLTCDEVIIKNIIE